MDESITAMKEMKVIKVKVFGSLHLLDALMVSAREKNLLYIIDLWRRLRRPFVLPESTQHHACEWENIDVDVLGCLVCGGIHACDQRTCKDVLQTNSSIVCAVSGVVLQNHMYSDVEFVDTAAITGPLSQFDEDIWAEVDSTIHNIFLSARSKQYKRQALCEVVLRWSRADITSVNLVTSCIKIVHKLEQHPYIFSFVSVQRREELAVEAANECRRILRFIVTCGMPVKAQEVQRLTVGVLYLMQHGISTGNNVILKQQKDMCQILPAENCLLKFYGIHPKFITETENRIKFCLRMQMDEPAFVKTKQNIVTAPGPKMLRV